MGAKTDTNKAKEEIVAFCPREGGAGRFRTESGQEKFTAPELLSQLRTLHLHGGWGLRTGAENRTFLKLYRKSISGFLVACLGSFLKENV